MRKQFNTEFENWGVEVDDLIHRKNSYQLTQRKSEILRLLVKGYSHQMICNELFISYETVRPHVKNIYSKLNAKRVSEVVVKAIREELLR